MPHVNFRHINPLCRMTSLSYSDESVRGTQRPTPQCIDGCSKLSRLHHFKDLGGDLVELHIVCYVYLSPLTVIDQPSKGLTLGEGRMGLWKFPIVCGREVNH